MPFKTVLELQATYDKVSGALGTAAFGYERGEVSGRELSRLKRLEKLAMRDLRAAQYGRCRDPLTFCACEHDCSEAANPTLHP